MEIIRKIKKYINVEYHTRILENRLKYTNLKNYLIDKTINSKEKGVSDKLFCSHEVIVSLTTHGKRINDVAYTIESIMQGTIKPNRIVLWIDENTPPTIGLPYLIEQQICRGLEVIPCKDLRSYTKLIPALKKFPESIIITIDDDAIYSYDLVENLVKMHNAYPKYIISNRVHRIKLDANNRPLSYMQWKWCDSPKDDSTLNFLTGVGGVLYPPHSLSSEVLHDDVFLEICKYADDIWFYAMAVMAGTRIIKGYTHSNIGEDYLSNEDVQDIGLCHINTNSNIANVANDLQFKSVFDRYNLWNKLIEV